MIIVFMTVFLLGSLGGSNSSNSTTSICSTSNVLCSGTSLTYNSSNASTQAATTEFQNLNYSSAASSQNPLEVINAHKAYGYGLTGSGETIAILDAGFSTSHDELDSKTITQYGTQTAATGKTSTADHGLIVSSVAAGEDDGTGMQGVAPGASLHWASYNQRNGNTYYPTHWANATDNASSAVVQNNSWGIDYQIDSLQSDISSNSWTNAYGIAQKFHSSGYTANEASANAYITALDNFQDHGVIVYALSNTTSYTDADFQAALPVLFSQLEEAWITAVNVEITGSSGNETYARKSAPCGSTGKYCLGADGYQIVGAGYDSSATNLYWQPSSGTSFVAPQISGAVALLSEAFPNHNPEQLTDRLLASADNTFFSHDAAVTFGNGVSHGYDDEFGHGILDIYAALNPITSSAYTRIYTGKSSEVGEEYQLGNSKLLTSSSLGDSLQKGLIGEVGYTYDDLGGGFEYDMSYHVNLISNNEPKFNLSEELKSLTSPIDNSLKTKDSFNLNQGISIGLSALPVQSFFDSNSVSSTNLQS
jgi:subtilase-type serine protease